MYQGVIFAILAAVLFGASTPLSKIMVGKVDPWLQAGLLYLGSGIGIGILFFIRSFFKNTQQSLLKADLKWLFAATFFGGMLGPVFLMYGLTQTSGSTASLLLNLEGVLTSILAWTVFREHFSKRIAWGMVSIVLGGIILSWSSSGQQSGLIGPIFVALACVAWAADNNFTRKISASDPLQITMIKSLFAGIVNILLAFYLGAKGIAIGNLVMVSLIGFLGYGMSIICFIFALRYIGTSRTGAYFSTAPFVGSAISIFLLAEPITNHFLVAAGFMAFGVWLHLSEDHGHEHTHEPLEHSHEHTHDEHHQHDHENGIVVANGSHSHVHIHLAMTHTHKHFPDIHHRHEHTDQN